MFRVGIGYDVHRLAAERKLILGGVHIPYELGADGHSDADVLIHAIMDALLGAMGMPDIGVMFPDTDEAYRDISSMLLLGKVISIMKGRHYQLGNLDCVVMAERPRLYPHITAIKKNICSVFNVDESLIGVKATTTEGLDAVGEGRGVAAQAVVLLQKI